MTAQPADLADPLGTSQQQRFRALMQLSAMQRESMLWHMCSTVPGAVERAYRLVTHEDEPGPVALVQAASGDLLDFYRDLPGPDDLGPGLDGVADVDEHQDQGAELGADVDEHQDQGAAATVTGDEGQPAPRRRGGRHRRQ